MRRKLPKLAAPACARLLSISTLSMVAVTLPLSSAPPPPEMRFEPAPDHAPEPADNPATPEKIALGRFLFFDPILSATKDVACASCHHPYYGWGDGRPTPIGVGGVGLGPKRHFVASNSMRTLPRNTPTLLNVGFNGLVAEAPYNPAQAPMFWDARVFSLEAQLLVPIRSREEMRGDACLETEAISQAVARVAAIPEYRQLFARAFQAPPAQAVTTHRLARAIASFERSIIAVNTPFDRFLRGDHNALNTEQQRGWQLFQQAGCNQCHGGPMFSDYKLHFIGVPDTTADGSREFRTPTLRNLSHTAPYMHNGSLATLRDVLVFYEALSDAVAETLDGGDATTRPRLDPLLHPLNLTPDGFPALEAFLHALNDDTYDRSLPDHLPSHLPISRE